MKKNIIAAVFVLSFVSLLQAQIRHAVRVEDGVVLETSSGTMKLRVINGAVIHVISSPVKDLPKRKNLSEVDNLTGSGKFTLAESDSEVVLKTSTLIVKVRKLDASIRYYDTSGHSLLQEMAGGKIFTKADLPGDTAWTVEQKYVSPDDEAIVGLGQYQFDVMNWKNGHMKMHQQNTAIASPVIVSNKGYGLFWNNYSYTEFNPEVEPIPLTALDDNAVGADFKPRTTGRYTIVLERPGSAPVEMTMNDSILFRMVAGVGYSPSIVMQDLEAGKTYSIKIKNLAKQINPVISSKYLLAAGGQDGQHGLKGEYFSNMKLEGAPSFVRVDSVIDFDWGENPPQKGFKREEYSVRWTGKIVAPASIKNVSIDAATDDGVRVFIDGKKVIDDWRDRSPETDSYVMDMEAGKTYDIRIEYYQNGGGASARLAWNAERAKHTEYFSDQIALFCRTPEMAPCMSFKSQVADAIDYYFMYGPEPDQIVAGMRTVTGKAPLYPKWAYGLFMSQYGWKTQEKIKSVIDGYRDRKIPLDVVVQDADYWPQFPNNLWGSHIFDSSRYSDPKAMVEHIHLQDAHTIVSVWPRINKGTDVYDSMDAKGFLLGLQDTRLNTNEGAGIKDESPNAAYDPFNPEARKLFWHFINKRLFKLEFDGWWMDASEPEWGYDFSRAHTAMGTGRRYLNVYPLMSTKGVYEGQLSTRSTKRPYILTRSSFVGQQRFAATTWNGDVSPDWDTYRKEIPAGLNYCATGMPYWTVDIGGFVPYAFADSPEYPELLVRWYEYGTFLPILRVHGCRKTEFWNYDKKTEGLLTTYTNLRYRLMPFLYSLSAKVTFENFTIYRALMMDFRSDAGVYNITDQFMFGKEFLVCPVVRQHAQARKVYLPKTAGGWRNFWNGRNYPSGQTIDAAAPLETIPLFVKAGSIVPMGDSLQYAEEKTDGTIELRVYTGADGSFNLYEDENDNFDYEKGISSVIPFSWKEKTKTLTIGARKGEYPGMIKERKINVVFVGEDHGAGIEVVKNIDKELLYKGKSIRVKEH